MTKYFRNECQRGICLVYSLALINNIISLITEENERSVAFHEKHGYILVGKLNKVGLKFNKRLDVLIYQKEI